MISCNVKSNKEMYASLCMSMYVYITTPKNIYFQSAALDRKGMNPADKGKVHQKM